MRLSEFIVSHIEEILTEWESFASTVLPGRDFDKANLRDDAAEMLTTIAKDMGNAANYGAADRQVQRSRP